jgi:glutamate-5-semialdehyde dehydrogenase
MSQDVLNHLRNVKKASYALSELDEEKRQKILLMLADNLRASYKTILAENQKDLAALEKSNPLYDRLLLSKERIYDFAQDVENVANMNFSTGQILEDKKLPNGLKLQKISVPLGVVGVIYESRPNVTIDVFSLCFKTGNACVLKGGKEAVYSNQCLVSLIHKTLKQYRVDADILYLLPLEREATKTLLNANGLIDVCIPRGSQTLIDFVRENARIPVIETGAGIVHTYFDQAGDVVKGIKIINNAKTRRVSVCNALDTLVIHEAALVNLPQLVELLAAKKVEIFADKKSYMALSAQYPKALLHKAKPEDFGREFLSYKMSIKTVASLQEAVTHIMHATSGHSEAIITEDESAAQYFVTKVDAAAVYVNTSTAFTDGAQFGLGAEIGISTQKLHARGPMALEALCSYKWVIYGNGQTRP